MAKQPPIHPAIKLRRLEITNFKAIDHLVLEFPQPRMLVDPDVFVMGSKNGLGKTSILEACVFLLEAAFSINSFSPPEIDWLMPRAELFIRAGAQESILQGTFNVGDEEHRVNVVIKRSGVVKIGGNREVFKELFFSYYEDAVELSVSSPLDINIEPVVLPACLYFHSYRKVQEGNPELGMLADRGRHLTPISTFKLHILRAMMGQANLFENIDNKKSKDVLEKLNGLVKQYAGGTIDKLRPSSNNTVEFRILPTQGGDSFSFDGLSSGQKEIISTLFLIWYYTNDRPSIVLIDEPELHLNAEWHREFVQQVFKLAPNNQYIIATHSEDVFGSVPADRRILLTPSQG